MARRSVFVGAALLITLSVATVAEARRHHYSSGAARNRSINSIRSQVAQFEAIAKQAEGVVAANKAKVDSANSRLSGDREAISTAHSEGKQATKDMASAEHDLLDAAGSESEIGMSKEKYEATRADMQREQNRVLHSPEYLAEAAKTEGTADRAAALPKIREKYLSTDADYQHALTMYEVARKQFNGKRMDALTHDEHWLAAAEDAKKALLAEGKALNDGKSGGLQKLPAAVAMHQAQKLAQQARAYAAQGRSMLGAMGAGGPAVPKQPAPTTEPTLKSSGN
jgi:chromosome segregation ATPase